VDSDSDGLTDFQECSGITLADGTLFPSCVLSPATPRSGCLHPDSKDLFIIYAPATGTLLPGDFNPFSPVTYYGVSFTGLAALSVTAHQITPAQAFADRTVTAGSTQKALRGAESVDTNGTILGNCQWGTPNGLDGCVIYTQRIRNFITSACGTNAIVLPGTSTASTVDQVFLAYSVHTFLHEMGHSTGGMTAAYNSSYGGYHYKCGAGTMMEQCVTYSAKGGKCSFNISGGWDTTKDPPTIRLK